MALSSTAQSLFDRLKRKKATIGIVGLGYVGLPLLWTYNREGYHVLGFDVDESKIAHLANGTSYIRHFGVDKMEVLAASDRVDATTDFARISEVDAIVLCVPTPLDGHREPDMSYVQSTVNAIGPYLRKGQIVVLESTTYPGTTEELITPTCEELSGLKSGEDFFVAYSPEREDPGNPNFETSTIPKVVGGDGADALTLGVELYRQVIGQVVPVSNTRTAEAVKLLENIFRSVNIALANELKVVFHAMDIDIYEVVDAAKTKPFGFMAFYPGPGLGGHCIPIDPFYLTWKAREYGLNTRFIELAGEINTSMPSYVVTRCFEALNDQGKALRGARVLCVGMAYKPNVDDMRETPTLAVMDKLKEYGADLEYYDPFIPAVPMTREHPEWAGLESVSWEEALSTDYDLVLVLTNHRDVDHDALAGASDCVVDTRNAVSAGLGAYRA